MKKKWIYAAPAVKGLMDFVRWIWTTELNGLYAEVM